MAGIPRPRVSVITPFYNAERFIAETIESVLAQTFDDYEYILVDDGSSDGGRQIVERFVERFPDRMRIITHQGGVNRGLPASRNAGVAAARGEMIAPLDADDVWSPDKLAAQLALFDQFPAAALVCGSAVYWQSWSGGEDRLVASGHVQDCLVNPPDAALNVYPLGTGVAPCPSDWLVRRSAVDAIGGWEEDFSGARALFEDQAFLAKLHIDFPVYFSSVALLKYRLHDTSIMASVTSSGERGQVKRYFLDWLVAFYERDRQGRRALLRKARKRRQDLDRRTMKERARRALPQRIRAKLSSLRGRLAG